MRGCSGSSPGPPAACLPASIWGTLPGRLKRRRLPRRHARPPGPLARAPRPHHREKVARAGTLLRGPSLSLASSPPGRSPGAHKYHRYARSHSLALIFLIVKRDFQLSCGDPLPISREPSRKPRRRKSESACRMQARAVPPQKPAPSRDQTSQYRGGVEICPGFRVQLGQAWNGKVDDMDSQLPCCAILAPPSPCRPAQTP